MEMPEDYKKDFQKWHELKKILDELELFLPCKEKEIWWAVVGVNIGSEIDGRGENFWRPVLIIRTYNKEQALIVPLTQTPNTNGNTHIHIMHPRLSRSTSAAISQIQTISNKRLWSYIGILDSKQFSLILEKIINSISKRTKPTS